MVTFVYCDHALDMLAERSIDRAWIERTVLVPETTEPDPKHPERTRAFRAVPERDGRVLRVVYKRLMTTFGSSPCSWTVAGGVSDEDEIRS